MLLSRELESKVRVKMGGMRELRERFEVVEARKHSRGKGYQLIVIER